MDEAFVVRCKDPLATNRLGEYAIAKVLLIQTLGETVLCVQ
jgi:hypothetical protein